MAVLLLLLASATAARAEKGTFRFAPRAPSAPPDLSVSVRFTESSGDRILDAGETGAIVVTIENRAKTPAASVKATVAADRSVPGLSFEREIPFGTIAGGGKVERTLALRAGDDLPGEDVRLKIEFREENGFNPDPVSIAFRTRALVPPSLSVADVSVRDQSGNGKIEPMEMVEVTARIANEGPGEARDVTAEVKPGKNVFFPDPEATRFAIGRLAAGAHKDIAFTFYTNKSIPHNAPIPVTIALREARPKYAVVKALDLVMNAPHAEGREIVFGGAEEPRPGPESRAAEAPSAIDVDRKIPKGKKAGKYDVAVVIGNRKYQVRGVPEVEFADRDARVMREYLVTAFGYLPENIIYEENATFATFNEIFGSPGNPRGKLHNYVREGVSSVFIYYVGHGAPDLSSHEAYFVPVDASPQYIGSSGYRLQTFYENVGMLDAKSVTIVLDSCFSGSSAKGLLFQGISPAMVQVKKGYGAPKKAVLLTSAAEDQVATWYSEKRHSLFTYFFLKGIQGEADANADGAISVGELRAYLDENVPYMSRRLNGVEQTPVVTGNENEILLRIGK